MQGQAAHGPGGAEAGADRFAGELVTQVLAYDGWRQVTVYVPPERPQAVVFAGTDS